MEGSLSSRHPDTRHPTVLCTGRKCLSCRALLASLSELGKGCVDEILVASLALSLSLSVSPSLSLCTIYCFVSMRMTFIILVLLAIIFPP